MADLELKAKDSTNREAIELFLVSEEGSVELTDKQNDLLRRWTYADEVIRKGEVRGRETIAQLLIMKFKVSRATAYQDIVHAEQVFSSSTPLNKRFRIGLRIEFLEKKIDELYELQDNMSAVMLEKSLQKYYDCYPDIAPVKSPKKIVYNIQNNILPAAGMSADDALMQGLKMLEIKPNDTNGNPE